MIGESPNHDQKHPFLWSIEALPETTRNCRHVLKSSGTTRQSKIRLENRWEISDAGNRGSSGLSVKTYQRASRINADCSFLFCRAGAARVPYPFETVPRFRSEISCGNGSEIIDDQKNTFVTFDGFSSLVGGYMQSIELGLCREIIC